MSTPEEIARKIEAKADAPAADPVQAPKRGPGRPKGSGVKPKSTGTATTATKAPYVASDESIAACAVVGRLLWGVAAPWIKCRELTDDESFRLGAAIDPLLHKYLPGLDGWREEVTFLLAVVGLYSVTRIEGDNGTGKSDNYDPGTERIGQVYTGGTPVT